MKLSISLRNGVRVETLSEKILKLLEKAAVYSMGMAVESGSQRIMDHMNRGQKLKQLCEKIKMVKRITKIRMTGFFILGYPLEKKEDILKTIELAKKLPIKRAQFTVWMPIPGNEMSEILKSKGQAKY